MLTLGRITGFGKNRRARILKSMNLRPILYINGLLLCMLSVAMSLPMLVDLHYGHEDWRVFFISILITAFFGGMITVTNTCPEIKLSLRQGFLLTTSSWLVVGLFAAIPFALSDMELSLTDSIFEAISGITTTGATILPGIETAPPGILMWRAILQWLGGIGIIVMALSLLPFLGVGGMQLFRTESSERDKAMPRAAQLASSICLLYLGLSILCVFAYLLAGFSMFDAVAHAMTTISTGGYSTYDASFMNFDSPHKEIVAIIFMVLGSLPFLVYLHMVRGDLRAFWADGQVKWFFLIWLGFIAAIFFWHIYDQPDDETPMLHSAFTVTALMTGTGYANNDYANWAAFPTTLFLFMMLVGGCAGSTTCGIKIFRFQILYEIIRAQIKQSMRPHGVFIPTFRGRPLEDQVTISVLSFFFVYALCFAVIALLLSATSLDFITAVSGAASAISNVGPGLGPIIGPAGNYTSLSDMAKWVLCAGMIIGRLELFTVLILLSPQFWRR